MFMKNILSICIKKKLEISILIFIIISICLFIFLRGSNDEKERGLNVIKCNAEVIIHSNVPGMVANVNIDFSVNSTSGIVSIDGKLYKDNKSIGVISRRIIFYVYSINDILLLRSVNNWASEVNSIDDTLINEIMIHEFYTTPNRKMQITFSKKEAGYYGISTKSIPFIYCSPR
ncbi:Uncharacterised protein [Yersinia frederiksenii]|nr:Uncharacterised protein [Yersinia frederiksenii]